MKLALVLNDSNLLGLAYKLPHCAVHFTVDTGAHTNNLTVLSTLTDVITHKPGHVLFLCNGHNDKAIRLGQFGAHTLFGSVIADRMSYEFNCRLASSFGMEIWNRHIKGVRCFVHMLFVKGKPIYPGFLSIRTTRFMTGNLGQDTTGQTCVVMPFDRKEPRLVQEHKKVWYLLQAEDYTGMFTLECVVKDGEIYFKNYYAGFMYNDIYAMLQLFPSTEAFFKQFIEEPEDPLYKSGYGYAVNISVPPYPNAVHGEHDESEIILPEDKSGIYFNDVKITGEKYFCGNKHNNVLTAACYGEDMEILNGISKDMLYHIKIKNKQYRIDGIKIADRDMKTLREGKFT